MSEQQPRKPRNPFEDEAKLQVDPVGALCDRMDWLRENHLMLSFGTQGVIQSMQNLEKKIDAQNARDVERVAKIADALNANSAQLVKLSERQLWVVAMAAAPCLLVLCVGVLAAWHYFHGAIVVSVASATVLP